MSGSLGQPSRWRRPATPRVLFALLAAIAGAALFWLGNATAKAPAAQTMPVTAQTPSSPVTPTKSAPASAAPPVPGKPSTGKPPGTGKPGPAKPSAKAGEKQRPTGKVKAKVPATAKAKIKAKAKAKAKTKVRPSATAKRRPLAEVMAKVMAKPQVKSEPKVSAHARPQHSKSAGGSSNAHRPDNTSHPDTHEAANTHGPGNEPKAPNPSASGPTKTKPPRPGSKPKHPGLDALRQAEEIIKKARGAASEIVEDALGRSKKMAGSAQRMINAGADGEEH